MRLQRLILSIAVIGTVTALIGCAQATDNVGTPLVFSTATSTASNAQIFTTSTPSAQPTITDTLTPQLTKAPTAIPTLAFELAVESLQELSASNGDCDLPCLWGIIPGKSDYQDAQVVLEPLSGISESSTFTPMGGGLNIFDINGDVKYYTHIAYLNENQGVNRVSFDAALLKKKVDAINGEYWVGVYDSNLFQQRFQPYTLSGVLSKLGIPAEVVISTDGGSDRGRNVPGFYVLLVYPEQGVLVRYTTFRQLTNGTVKGCLTNAHAEFELFPSGQADLFSNNVDSTDWANWWPVPDDSLYWKPIEKATSLSLQEFYETFRQPTDKCLETPANIWYLPG